MDDEKNAGVFYGLASVSRQADVFSRGSLVLTYELLRGSAPQLALEVRNIVHGKALQSHSSQASQAQDELVQKRNRNSDHFRVQLSAVQVRAIVEGLAGHREKAGAGSGNAVMAQTLIEDWVVLAQKMVEELSE
ncbi:hypothetical protein O4H49_02755 [Kiloniella laminariae]|uniref:Uncharacterized protein n=1 Tax=Kiloniella laminariae TaxID=454162 RepID=A0ABT4LF16_9PROT|nr:hypothetical protein [Kiloniella laminariae]MCZ4279682.1 hypothetical protein [Kiloniella laminariae]